MMSLVRPGRAGRRRSWDARRVTKATPRPGRGRQPDPEIESKVYTGALLTYARTGWTGFTIDAVAAECRVGKAAIYRRWANKEELLVAAIHARGPESEPNLLHFDGDAFGSLVTWVEKLVAALTAPVELVMVRAQLEAKLFPEVLGTAMEELRLEWVEAARTFTAAAQTEGDLPRDISTSLLFDSIRGTVLNRLLLSPEDRLVRLQETRAEFARALVTFALRGLGAAGSDTSVDAASPRVPHS